MMQAKNQIKMKRIDPTSYVYNKNPLHKLGEGSFGDVFLGFDEQNKIPVAVKTISLEKIQTLSNSSERIFATISRQIVNMQIANSDEFVKLLNANKSQRNIYIICEFCNGGSLKDFLKIKSYLTEHEALSFFKQILKGFKLLHEKRVVHRDLKPANILLHNFKIKIGDLGLSKTIGFHEQLLQSIVGSPMYMSPQILMNQKYTQKTDIWSLGVILYEMLYGDGPWKIVTSFQQIRQKVKKKIQFPKNFNTTIQTKKLINKMLQYSEEDRISWQQLFAIYLGKQDQMKDETEEQWNDFQQYFGNSIYLERQDQIIKVLSENKLNFMEVTGLNSSGSEFFQYFYQSEINKSLFTHLLLSSLEMRNKICFFMKLFFISSFLSKSIHHPFIYQFMFLLLRQSLNLCSRLLSLNFSQEQYGELYLKSTSYVNCNQLIKHDLDQLKKLYCSFYENYYLSRMESDFGSENVRKEEVHKKLKGLYESIIGEDSFVNHLFENSVSIMFNFLKLNEGINDQGLFLARLLYDYRFNQKMFGAGIKKNTLKCIEDYKIDEKWKKQIKKIEPFSIESVDKFLSRQIQWNPFQLHSVSYL